MKRKEIRLPAPKSKLPRAAERSHSAAAGLAATTRGRVRVFKDKRNEIPPAKKQIEDELSDE